MSVFSYNTITLPYVYVSDVKQEPVYDDFSQTDWYCTKIDIQLQSVINLDYIELIDPTLVNQPLIKNAADIMNKIRVKLMQPRRQLTLSFNGTNLIPPDNSLPGTVDVMNGPQPQSCNIVQLTNTTFLIQYHIITYRWEETSDAAIISNNVLYNRWTETVDIDACNFTKWTRSGKYKIRTDNVNGAIADTMRDQMALVGILQGCLRESSQYTVTPDGLAIQYKVVDKEYYKPPPFPAYEASGTYKESSPRGDAKRFAECRVHLKGSKTTDQAKLVRVAMAIVGSKLAINGAPLTTSAKNSRAIMEQTTVEVDMFKNEVEVYMRVMFKNSRRRVLGIPGIRKTTCFTPFVDGVNVILPVYTQRGTVNRLLQAAAYYDPSFRNNIMDTNTGQMTMGLEVGQAGVRPEL